MLERYDLEARYDHHKSFYQKAVVYHDTDFNEKVLYSYGTKVAWVGLGEMDAQVYGTYSVTTLRHIKEFLTQEGFEATSKKQIEKDYM